VPSAGRIVLAEFGRGGCGIPPHEPRAPYTACRGRASLPAAVVFVYLPHYARRCTARDWAVGDSWRTIPLCAGLRGWVRMTGVVVPPEKSRFPRGASGRAGSLDCQPPFGRAVFAAPSSRNVSRGSPSQWDRHFSPANTKLRQTQILLVSRRKGRRSTRRRRRRRRPGHAANLRRHHHPRHPDVEYRFSRSRRRAAVGAGPDRSTA